MSSGDGRRNLSRRAGVEARARQELQRGHDVVADVGRRNCEHRCRHDVHVEIVCKLRRDGARLKIFFPRQSVDGAVDVEPWFRPGGWRYAALNLERLDEVGEVADAVAAAGGTIVLAASSHRPGARMALVTDPEGNTWELLAGTDVTEGMR